MGSDLVTKRSVREIEALIRVLCVACDEPTMRLPLERLLEFPNEQRVAFVEYWLNDLRAKKAPADFIEAISCLLDAEIAARAYESLFRCSR